MNASLPNSKLDTINSRVYHNARVFREYSETTLAREDAIGLLKYQPAFLGKDVLDIGAGTGRTAIYLAALADHYQAVDYSPTMVDRFRENLPGVPIALADMRDLSRFADATFDFVLASNNVFDAVGHTDRLRILDEMHRLLRPGGILMFSAHNRNASHLMHGPRLHFHHNPVTQAMLVLHWILALVNYMKLRGLQSINDDYAIVNDEAHDCGLLQYYIGTEAQRRQLATRGFDLLETLDRFGTPVPSGQQASHSRWLLYVARSVQVS